MVPPSGATEAWPPGTAVRPDEEVEAGLFQAGPASTLPTAKREKTQARQAPTTKKADPASARSPETESDASARVAVEQPPSPWADTASDSMVQRSERSSPSKTSEKRATHA